MLRPGNGYRIKSGVTMDEKARSSPLRPQEEPICAVYPQRRHLLPKVRLLIDKLREELPGALSRSEAL